MKIAVVTPLLPTSREPDNGIFIYRTLLELKKLADLEVFCLMGRSPGKRRVDPNFSPAGLPVTYLEYPILPVVSRRLNGFTCALTIAPYLRRAQPDLVLAYWLYPEGYGAYRAARRLNLPVILGTRGTDLRRGANEQTRTAVSGANAVLAVSDDLRQRAIAAGAKPENVHAISNGCDASVFHLGDRVAARASLGIDPGTKLILFVGRLIPTKGLNELYAAYTALRQTRDGARLAVIGEGDLSSSSEGVRMLRRLPAPEVAKWMAACDVFCLPSYSEGCPNVVVEALASGRPVVATDVGGIPELVNEQSGILVPAKDVSALKNALEESLQRLWDEPAIAHSMSRSWGDAARETMAVCETVLRESAK